MMKTVLVILSSLLIACPVYALETSLPPAPEGYSWTVFEETKSAFLKPNGWFVKKMQKGETWGYFITKEDIEKSGKFITGLSVNIVPNIPKKKGMSPVQYANEYIQTAARSKEVRKEPWATEMGPFKAFGVVLLNKDPKQGDFITHNLAIGNEATGTFYTIIYEGPASSWDATWKVGEPMLQRFLIDSDI